jgi:dienelactone hydrolase
MSNPRDIQIELAPNPAFVDDEVSIRVRGLRSGQSVVIRASASDDEQRTWRSHAKFRADASGSIDVWAQESRGGSYRGISPMGLFWSMRLDARAAAGHSTFAKTGATPDRVIIELESGRQIAASTELERLFLAPDSESHDLTVGDAASGNGHGGAKDCVGRLFIPPGRGPHPVVIVLSGSGGGFDLDKAAALSRHGFATLALAYFGVPPLPAWLHRIPLDYFQAAFSWLALHPELDLQQLGALGVSRGAELALLLASRFPQIRAVVAYAPSSVAWSSGGRDNSTGEIIPCWTWRGEPVPFAPLPLRSFVLRSAIPVGIGRRPVMFRNLFRSGLRNREAVERAAIPVEQIRGPLMLVSGGDDHVWPAAEMAEAIRARLKTRAFPHAVEHLHYPHAGHMLRYPFLPTTSRESRHRHLRNARFSFGGTPDADAHANADSWRQAIRFLRASLA